MGRNSFSLVLLAGVLTSASARAQATILAPPARGTPYPVIRTWHEQSLMMGLTKAEHLEVLRSAVRSGPLGQRGLDRMFKNFEGYGSFDPSTPGMAKNLLLTTSRNGNVGKGAARTHLYAARLSENAQFKLLAINERQYSDEGRMVTDKDVKLRHVGTGRECRLEIKDVSVASQRTNLSKYKIQIDKMAAELSRTGELQAWVNRQSVAAEIKTYARERGISVFEKVISGERHLGKGEMRFDSVLESLDQQAQLHAKARAISGGAQIGFGIVLLVQTAPAAYAELAELRESRMARGNVLRLGEHGILAMSGGMFAVSGAIDLAEGFSKSIAQSSKLATMSKWGGRAGIVGAVAAEGFVYWQWRSGLISERQFVTSTSATAGAMAGAWAGAKAGALAGAYIGGTVGSVVPGLGTAAGVTVGTTIGAFTGGVAGGFAGHWVVAKGAATLYEFKDKERELRYEEFLYAYYGAR